MDSTASALPAQTAPAHPFAPDTLWNTVYMQQIIAEMRAEGIHVRDEDIAHLSPLKFALYRFPGPFLLGPPVQPPVRDQPRQPAAQGRNSSAPSRCR
ncbi:Tn3 family transposase [Streptomyces sp. NPDC058595]|uniref:Tn3 family transposase n=1 Tax=Streptomyces sp. NPDC058595 TaxID=3346550 RepID=UPI0036620CFB